MYNARLSGITAEERRAIITQNLGYLKELITEIDPEDTKSLKFTKILSLMTSSRKEFLNEFEKAVSLWQLPEAYSDLLNIPTDCFSRPELPKWALDSIFQVAPKGPSFLNLSTLQNTVWYHKTQITPLVKVVTGHKFLETILPSYSLSKDIEDRKNTGYNNVYSVNSDDIINHHYNLSALEWLQFNARNLPKRLLDWISHDITLCAWAGAVRDRDGCIRIPELDVKSGEIKWFYLGPQIISSRKALAEKVGE